MGCRVAALPPAGCAVGTSSPKALVFPVCKMGEGALVLESEEMNQKSPIVVTLNTYRTRCWPAGSLLITGRPTGKGQRKLPLLKVGRCNYVMDWSRVTWTCQSPWLSSLIHSLSRYVWGPTVCPVLGAQL